jgi:hypothetical protein
LVGSFEMKKKPRRVGKNNYVILVMQGIEASVYH